jgi:hypothetical protein
MFIKLYENLGNQDDYKTEWYREIFKLPINAIDITTPRQIKNGNIRVKVDYPNGQSITYVASLTAHEIGYQASTRTWNIKSYSSFSYEQAWLDIYEVIVKRLKKSSKTVSTDILDNLDELPEVQILKNDGWEVKYERTQSKIIIKKEVSEKLFSGLKTRMYEINISGRVGVRSDYADNTFYKTFKQPKNLNDYSPIFQWIISHKLTPCLYFKLPLSSTIVDFIYNLLEEKSIIIDWCNRVAYKSNRNGDAYNFKLITNGSQIYWCINISGKKITKIVTQEDHRNIFDQELNITDPNEIMSEIANSITGIRKIKSFKDFYKD